MMNDLCSNQKFETDDNVCIWCLISMIFICMDTIVKKRKMLLYILIFFLIYLMQNRSQYHWLNVNKKLESARKKRYIRVSGWIVAFLRRVPTYQRHPDSFHISFFSIIFFKVGEFLEEIELKSSRGPQEKVTFLRRMLTSNSILILFHSSI